jgi:c(7)-type cytochrome triheme protein
MKLAESFFLLFCFFLIIPAKLFALGVPKAETYGRVIIDNYSRKAGAPGVVFDHWLHRSMFTCRLCHVDIGFAMEARATGITAELNKSGQYCGACHNGSRLYQGRRIFNACKDNPGGDERKVCNKCHSMKNEAAREYRYDLFSKKFPVRGGMIDWEEAEAQGIVKPLDFIEGISVKRPKLNMDKEVVLESKTTWMSNVRFSHKKHAVWNGCEVCHPEIFPSTSKGSVKFTMIEISGGEYCGVCHTKVAFSLFDCSRCHTTPVN